VSSPGLRSWPPRPAPGPDPPAARRQRHRTEPRDSPRDCKPRDAVTHPKVRRPSTYPLPHAAPRSCEPTKAYNPARRPPRQRRPQHAAPTATAGSTPPITSSPSASASTSTCPWTPSAPCSALTGPAIGHDPSPHAHRPERHPGPATARRRPPSPAPPPNYANTPPKPNHPHNPENGQTMPEHFQITPTATRHALTNDRKPLGVGSSHKPDPRVNPSGWGDGDAWSVRVRAPQAVSGEGSELDRRLNSQTASRLIIFACGTALSAGFDHDTGPVKVGTSGACSRHQAVARTLRVLFRYSSATSNYT